MDTGGRRRELGRFLFDRRNRLSPTDVGLPDGARRRVKGLRREEVATLAGVGVTWYTMLENGTAAGVSAKTLNAIADALRLSADEVGYLVRLAEDRQGDEPPSFVGTLARDALAAIAWAPAYICTSQWIVPLWNEAMSLVWAIDAPGGASFNIVARMFGDPRLRAMHGERFPDYARMVAGMVRAATASQGQDPVYQRMCDDLRRDPIFAAAWDAYEIAMPVSSIATTVDSAAIGAFSYRTLTLEIPNDGHFLVMQVPDEPSATRLRRALEASIAPRDIDLTRNQDPF